MVESKLFAEFLNQEDITSQGIVARVNPEICNGCNLCVVTCPYEAISLDKGIAVVNATECVGCGVCAGTCRSAAIDLLGFTDQQIFSVVNNLDEGSSTKILVFLCNFCSQIGGEIKPPSGTLVVKIPCSGRINPIFILKAIQKGWDGVIISGCHHDECNFGTADDIARRRFSMFSDFLKFAGLEEGRVNFIWVSEADGETVSKKLADTVKKVKSLGPNRLYKKEVTK